MCYQVSLIVQDQRNSLLREIWRRCQNQVRDFVTEGQPWWGEAPYVSLTVYKCRNDLATLETVSLSLQITHLDAEAHNRLACRS